MIKERPVKERLKTYRKFYSKDSIKKIRELDKYYKKKSDSIYRAFKKEDKLRRLAEKKGIPYVGDTLKGLKNYSSLISKDTAQIDSLKKSVGGLAKDELAEQLPSEQKKQLQELQGKYGAQSAEVQKYLTVLRDSVVTSDSLKSFALSKAGQMSSGFAEGQLSKTGAGNELAAYEKSLNEAKSIPGEYKAQFDSFQNTDSLQSKAEDVAKEKAAEKAAELMAQHMDKLKPIQAKMGLLKNKYSTLVNSNDLSTGIKSRSLEGRPLRERWVIGGNFTIPSTDPVMVDLSPQFGYRINKNFQIGVGGLYRATFTDKKKITIGAPGSVWGYSAFTSHSIAWNFFGYGELERVNRELKAKSADITNRIWVNNLLLGVGRKFSLHRKIKASVLFLWNPLHENETSIYGSEFVIKTGLHLSDLALIKK